MSTECLHCTKPKQFNCFYCGDPVCKDHVVYNEGHTFCTKMCIKLLERWGEKKQH